ncbi:helix-turn-helix domain-containing protein [Streptomyces bobili]|uniref:helix-turn-helix domain-containing protein n=1 Tax=Streptomyces bobili TaxID=67280 RepID=UPI0033A0A91B
MSAPDGEGDTLLLPVPRSAARELERILLLGLLAESLKTGAKPTAITDSIVRQLHTAAQTRPGFAPETPTAAVATVDPGFASRVLVMEEVAAVLGCSVQYARRLAQTGRLRAHRVGRTGPWLTTPQDLDAYRYGRQEDTSGKPGPEAEQS